MLKEFISLMVILTISFSTFCLLNSTSLANSNYTNNNYCFADIPYSSIYLPYIDKCYKMGLMSGTSKSMFNPEGEITRAQFITIIYRLDQKINQNYTKNLKDIKPCKFRDVKPTDWYSDAVNWGVTYKIINGTSTSTFSPNTSISRQDVATILYRYMDFIQKPTKNSFSIKNYSDYKNINAYAIKPMEWALSAKILNNTSDRPLKCDPQAIVTRAQCAKIFVSLTSHLLNINKWDGFDITNVAIETLNDSSDFSDFVKKQKNTNSAYMFVAYCASKCQYFNTGNCFNGITTENFSSKLINFAKNNKLYIANKNYIPQPGDLKICGSSENDIQIVLYTDYTNNKLYVHCIGLNSKTNSIYRTKNLIWEDSNNINGKVSGYIQPKMNDKAIMKQSYIFPLDKVNFYKITSPFGSRIHPIYRYRDFHEGIDFSAKNYAPIYASISGKVIKKATSSNGLGNHIIIQTDNEIETTYAHLSGFANNIKVNDMVEQGDIIGYAGKSGTASGVHLHFSIYMNGSFVNPELYMRVP